MMVIVTVIVAVVHVLCYGRERHFAGGFVGVFAFVTAVTKNARHPYATSVCYAVLCYAMLCYRFYACFLFRLRRLYKYIVAS